MIFDELRKLGKSSDGLGKSAFREYLAFRTGDIRHSLADIEKAKRLLQYNPTVRVQVGIEKTVAWFSSNTVSN